MNPLINTDLTTGIRRVKNTGDKHYHFVLEHDWLTVKPRWQVKTFCGKQSTFQWNEVAGQNVCCQVCHAKACSFPTYVRPFKR